MQLPKYRKRERKLIGIDICKYCGDKYEKYNPIQKYCPLHSDPKKRKKVRLPPPDLSFGANVTIEDFVKSDLINIEMACAFEYCSEKYRIRKERKIKVYPKYCELHRNREKRRQEIIAKEGISALRKYGEV